MSERGEEMGRFSRIGFIGGGQMAEALIKGLTAAGLFGGDRIVCSEPFEERRNYLAETYGVEVTPSNLKVLEGAEAFVLAVKPQVIRDVLAEIATAVTPEHLVISIAAGIRLEVLEGTLPEHARVVRVMPNTPALVQAGAAGVCGGSNAGDGDVEFVLSLFNAVGVAHRVPESLMDAVTGLSGSGPAYLFRFAQALIDAGVLVGLPRPVAHDLVVQTLYGAAKMMKETGRSPYDLTAMVTSPGGTTIAGLHAMEEAGFTAAAMGGVLAATERSKELG